MDQMRNKKSGPDRSSEMEKAEGSRARVRNSGSPRDSGTSSDRAMYDESSSGRSSSEHVTGRSSSSERGSRSSADRIRGSSDSGGITNRELSREEREQEELPERGKSQSER